MKRDLFQGLGRCGFVRKRLGSTVAIVAVSLLSVLPPAPTSASTTIRISNDRGGSVTARIREIRNIQRLGQKVEIRTGFCNSACTMYLGMDNTCVSSKARFGFHGPRLRNKGKVMSPAKFDQWSQVMANHYPPILRHWFMTEARHSNSLVTLRGDQLIALGVTQCV